MRTSRRVRAFSRLLFGTIMLAVSSAPVTAAPPPLSNPGPILEELERQAQDSALPEMDRVEMIQVLGNWEGSAVRPPLLALLKDPSPSIRAAAARALGWAGNREAVAGLRERVEADGETPAVRAGALEALGRIGDDSVRAVVLANTRSNDASVRGAALWSVTFGSLTSPSDRIALLRQVAKDRGLDLFMRCQSMYTLGGMKDTGSADLLMALLEHEPPMPMPLPGDGASQQELMMTRYRQARDVRAWAAIGLRLMQARVALPLLLKAAEDPDDFFLRLSSVQALVAWNAREALPVLIGRLEDPLQETRITALEGLSKLADPAAVDPALNMLVDRSPLVRAQAIMTLAALGDRRVVPQLEALQKKDEDSTVQQALEKALARLRH
jgi:HEAT repeat protein